MRLISIAILSLVFCAAAYSQDVREMPSTCANGVCQVSQEYFDDSAKAFAEVVALRQAVKDGKETVEAKNKAINELVALLREYAVIDKKDRKAWYAKAGKVLLVILDRVTDAASIKGIIDLIIISKALKD